MQQDEMKRQAAEAALEFVQMDDVVGVGTGSTVNFFIEALAGMRHKIDGAVASSVATAERLKQANIRLLDLNTVGRLPLYVDGADEADPHLRLIKGGGGALTREKIAAAASDKFVCVVDESKRVKILGKFPLPVEVIPMARAHVARELVKLGGVPEYREGCKTDNGNIILDVYNLEILDPPKMESTINDIAGVVTVGIFAHRPADLLIVGTPDGPLSVSAQ